MRRLLLLVFLTGCGEQGYANVSEVDAGDDTSAQGGTAGTDATMPPVDAGSDVTPVSCSLGPDQLSGTDTMAVVSSSMPEKTSCRTTTNNFVNVMQGVCSTDLSWTLANYSVVRSEQVGLGAGACVATLRFTKTTNACGMMTMSVRLTLPGI